jgi:hypothetical protein
MDQPNVAPTISLTGESAKNASAPDVFNVQNGDENPPAVTLDPTQEYIKSMHIFVEFQQEYIHNPDVRNMASQQEGYIKAQTRYIAFLLGQKK